MSFLFHNARTIRLAYIFTSSTLFIGAMASTTMQFTAVPDPRLCILLLVGNVVVAFSLLFRFFTSTKRDTTSNDTALIGGACVFALVQVVALSVASPNFIVTNAFNLPRGPSLAHMIFAYLALLFTSLFFLFFRPPKAVSPDSEKGVLGHHTNGQVGSQEDQEEEEECVAAVILNGVRNLSKKSSSTSLADSFHQVRRTNNQDNSSIKSKISLPRVIISKPIWKAPSKDSLRPKRIVKIAEPTFDIVKEEEKDNNMDAASISTTSTHPIADRFMAVDLGTNNNNNNQADDDERSVQLTSAESTPRANFNNSRLPRPVGKPSRLLTVPTDVNRATAFSADSLYSMRETTNLEYERAPTKSVVDRLSSGAFAYLGWKGGKI